MDHRQKIINYVQSLREKHHQIDRELNLCYNSYAPDHVVEDLKKRKLKIQDIIKTQTQKLHELKQNT